MIPFSVSVMYFRRNGNIMAQYISYYRFQEAFDSVRREVLYNILIEFRIPRKRVGIIIMCLNETYSRVRIGKYLTKFPIETGLRRRRIITIDFKLCFEICHACQIELDTSAFGLSLSC
jgi:hypothetical protein